MSLRRSNSWKYLSYLEIKLLQSSSNARALKCSRSHSTGFVVAFSFILTNVIDSINSVCEPKRNYFSSLTFYDLVFFYFYVFYSINIISYIRSLPSTYVHNACNNGIPNRYPYR